MRLTRLTFMGAVVLSLAGCYTAPIRPVALDDARAAVDGALANPDVATYAPYELQDAVATYGLAESTLRKDGYTEEARRLAYLAQQRAAIAQDLARLRVEAMTEEQARAQMAAREREMQAATRSEMIAEAHAESAQRAALEAEARARQAQQLAAAQRRAPPGAAPRMSVEAELRELSATRSDRGMVVTLNDVLFDPGSAMLRPGGQRLVARLADFLRDYPERLIAIEGFADSGGSDAESQALSERRAASVRLALMDAGVEGSRVFVRGYGQAFPVASNDTADGRKRNRRVEVVISDERGAIAPRVATYTGR